MTGCVWVIIWSPQWKSVLCDAYHFEINRCPYCSTVTGWWMPSSKPNFLLSYNNRRYYYFQLISHVSSNHQMPEWCTISIEKFSPTFHNMHKIHVWHAIWPLVKFLNFTKRKAQWHKHRNGDHNFDSSPEHTLCMSFGEKSLPKFLTTKYTILFCIAIWT